MISATTIMGYKMSAISIGDKVIGTAATTVVCCLFLTEGNAELQLEGNRNPDAVFPHPCS